jgi:hypothetical protein
MLFRSKNTLFFVSNSFLCRTHFFTGSFTLRSVLRFCKLWQISSFHFVFLCSLSSSESRFEQIRDFLKELGADRQE